MRQKLKSQRKRVCGFPHMHAVKSRTHAWTMLQLFGQRDKEKSQCNEATLDEGCFGFMGSLPDDDTIEARIISWG